MSKQLVMENYVDECLDEVEIRGLFITEGVMDTPLWNVLRPLFHKLNPKEKELKSLKGHIEHIKQQLIPYYKKKVKESEFERDRMVKIYHKDYLKGKLDGNEYWNKEQRLNNKVEETLDKLYDQKKELRTTIDKINPLKDEINRLNNAIVQAKNNPGMLGNVPYLYQIIGATAIVAAIAYASYKLYKRFMSKAAKACQNKKGKLKTICMNQYQIRGLELSKKPLTDGMKGCSKAKEVQACKAEFNKKINAIDKKIKKKQNQIKKLMGR